MQLQCLGRGVRDNRGPPSELLSPLSLGALNCLVSPKGGGRGPGKVARNWRGTWPQLKISLDQNTQEIPEVGAVWGSGR